MFTYTHVHVHVFSVVYVSWPRTYCMHMYFSCVHFRLHVHVDASAFTGTHTDYAHYVRAAERAIHTIRVHVLPAVASYPGLQRWRPGYEAISELVHDVASGARRRVNWPECWEQWWSCEHRADVNVSVVSQSISRNCYSFAALHRLLGFGVLQLKDWALPFIVHFQSRRPHTCSSLVISPIRSTESGLITALHSGEDRSLSYDIVMKDVGQS